MRNAISLLVLTLAVPVFSEGRKEPDPKEMAQKHAEKLAEHLDLSAEQSKQVSAIMKESAAESAELEKKLRDHQRKMHEKIRALLSDEQKERFDMMRSRMPMMGMGGRGGGMGGPSMGGPGMGGPGMMRKRGMPKDEPGDRDEREGQGGGRPEDDDEDRPGVMIDRGDDRPGPKPPR